MSRSTPRQAIAKECFQLAQDIIAIHAKARQALRMLDETAQSPILLQLWTIADQTFKTAMEVERGHLSIEQAGEDRPLFDKPPVATHPTPANGFEASQEAHPSRRILADPGMIVIDDHDPRYVEEFHPGTELSECNRCSAIRLRRIAVCPRCASPEYSLKIIDRNHEVVTQPADDPKQEPPAKPPRKKPAPHSPKSKLFKVIYNYDPELDPLTLTTIRARNFESARARFEKEFEPRLIELPDGRKKRIDNASVEFRQVPTAEEHHTTMSAATKTTTQGRTDIHITINTKFRIGYARGRFKGLASMDHIGHQNIRWHWQVFETVPENDPRAYPPSGHYAEGYADSKIQASECIRQELYRANYPGR